MSVLQGDVERKLSQMILDSKFHGTCERFLSMNTWVVYMIWMVLCVRNERMPHSLMEIKTINLHRAEFKDTQVKK